MDNILYKWQHTMEVFDEYEKRISKAKLDMPTLNPRNHNDKLKIIEKTKKVLGYKDELIPQISNVEEIRKDDFGTYEVSQLRYTTWENFYSSMSLYKPKTNKKVPLVFIFCGHGKDGRLTPNYVKLAHSLTSNGIAVIIPDNIGQGDRKDKDDKNHKFAIAPFYCGLSLQGMIVMEAISLIRYAKNLPWVDNTKIGSCGNSGGGTVNVFLSCICDDISAISASGYPSDFTYILSKEREHCACNILPGIANGPCMWEMLGVFSPKPMLLEQGINDCLIPMDLSHTNARKVRNLYIQEDKDDKFHFHLTNTCHSWEYDDRKLIFEFFVKEFTDNSDVSFEETEPDEEMLYKWKINIPHSSYTTKECAENISGINAPENIELYHVFPPTYKGDEISASSVMDTIGRGNIMKIFSQFEAMFKEL